MNSNSTRKIWWGGLLFFIILTVFCFAHKGESSNDLGWIFFVLNIIGGASYVKVERQLRKEGSPLFITRRNKIVVACTFLTIIGLWLIVLETIVSIILGTTSIVLGMGLLIFGVVASVKEESQVQIT